LSSVEHDSPFLLPGIDDPASTEAGVILMGLEVDRLLAGLGLAAFADDPTLVTMVVDQARHGALRDITTDALEELGGRRWLAVRGALDEAAGTIAPSAALRQLWVQATQAVDVADTGDLGPASRAYLAACWLRRIEVDRHLETARVPDVAS
jgi:uncharacterized protein DUF6187